MIIGIDSGPVKSAYVIWNGEKIYCMGIIENEELIQKVFPIVPGDQMAIEIVVNLGMPAVGASLFETSKWVGHFERAWKIAGKTYLEVNRREIKLYFCESCHAKDSNIRQALIDRFEPDLPPKRRPKGILKGVSKDCWSALAISVYYWDTQQRNRGKDERAGEINC